MFCWSSGLLISRMTVSGVTATPARAGMRSTRPSTGREMTRMSTGTRVPVPRTSTTIGPRVTWPVKRVCLSTTGAAGSRREMPTVIVTTTIAIASIKRLRRMRRFSACPVRGLSIVSSYRQPLVRMLRAIGSRRLQSPWNHELEVPKQAADSGGAVRWWDAAVPEADTLAAPLAAMIPCRAVSAESHRRTAPQVLGFGLITVSDTRSPEDDVSGRILSGLAHVAGHRVEGADVVLDDVAAIRRAVRRMLALPGVDVVVLTGGTGFSPRDVTIDAVLP